MALLAKSKPTSSFADRRAAWAVRRGENYIPRPPGYYAKLIEKEKAAQTQPVRHVDEIPESPLRLLVLSL
ncbi:MAG: hypothetical protein SFW65_07425 [Alphaproteobacteria bacterium]|nr:hypothetical protein [Alphaproteobacteria bacterium]